jgi:hypothetical protein
MHVDVDLIAIAFEKQQGEGKRRRGHQVVIRRRNGMQQQAIADEALVDENVDRVTIALLHLRARDEAAQLKRLGGRLLGLAPEFGDGLGRRHPRRWNAQLPPARSQVHEFVEHLAAEHLIDALPLIGGGGDVQQIRAAVHETECFVGMGQAVVSDQ